MKKVILLLIALAWVEFNFAQEYEYKSSTFIATSDKVSIQTKDISNGSIICNNGYISGTTMNLSLTIAFTSPGAEHLDGLTLTLPATLVPNQSGTSNPLTYNLDEWAIGNINLITPVSGQSISWGTIAAPFTGWGAVKAPCNETFNVNVTVGAGVTDPQTVNYTMFGDTFDGTIHTITGTFIVNPTALNDVGILSNDIASSFVTTVTPKATVKNFGSTAATFTATMAITGGYTSTKTVTALAGLASQQVIFDSWTATAGVATVKTYTTLAAADADASNDTIISTINMVNDSLWIHCDDVINSTVFGFNIDITFDVAHRFDINDLATMNGKFLSKVRFWPSEATSIYRIRVWTGGSNVGTLNPGTLVVDQEVPAFTTGAWNIITIDSTVIINSSQELWIGYNVIQNFGYSAGIDAGPALINKGNLISDGFGWTNLGVFAGIDGNWNIGGLVSATNLVSLNEEILGNSTEVSVYPNPVSSIIYIDNAANSKITVLNALGQVMKSIKKADVVSQINVSDLAKGTYIVNIVSDKQVINKKIEVLK